MDGPSQGVLSAGALILRSTLLSMATTDVLDDLLSPAALAPVAVHTAEVLHCAQDAAVVEFLSDGVQGLLSAVDWYSGQPLPQKHTRIQGIRDDRGEHPVFSATHSELPALLLSSLSPAIRRGDVRIARSVRMPGVRSKIAVAPTVVDEDSPTDVQSPIRTVLAGGTSMMHHMARVMYGERVDLVAWDDDPGQLLRNAMGQVYVEEVELGDRGKDGRGRDAVVYVPKAELGAAVGHRGSNSMLAGRLSGMRVSVRPSARQPEGLG